MKKDDLTFTPGLLAGETSRMTGRPEEDLLGEAIRVCERLRGQGVISSPSNQPYLREQTSLVARPQELLPVLDEDTGTVFA